MSKIKVAVNGFGRIGRVFTRTVWDHPQIELVAINELADAASIAHLLKYDSVHRGFGDQVSHSEKAIKIGNTAVKLYAEKDPEQLPWKALGIDVVIEATGKFRTETLSKKHLRAGAKKVIITAPPTDDSVKTVVLGINDDIIEPGDTIISNASCTTNSAAPLVQLLHEKLKIESAYITTVHSFTADQKLQDSYHKDLRRARAATQSIVPTTTGAAKALTKIFPDLNDVIGGCGIRVPVPDGSLTDLSCVVKEETDIHQINNWFKEASEGRWKNILQYTEDPIVSVDIIGNTHSCIFDADLTSVIGKMVKVVGWYDNEVGYSNRLKDLVLKLMA